MNNQEIAIYGGAFNPPTLAHLQVVEAVLQTSDISHIILSPSWKREDKDYLISQAERRKLIDSYLHILQNAGNSVSLDDYFFSWKNGWHTTTADEEKYFRVKLWVSPTFIFGSDVAAQMPTWSWNENRFIETKLKKIFIERPWYQFDFESAGFENYTMLEVPDMLQISSSVARNIVSTKWDVSGILHPEIEKLIEEHHLYL